MDKILLVTEANESVASGYLFECIETCNYLLSKNINTFLKNILYKKYKKKLIL